MKEVKDLYSRLAEETGLSREAVKMVIILRVVYSIKTAGGFEAKCRELLGLS